jgi:gamma-glutamyltranspeptidase/glutathione hydrolase
MRNLHIPSRSPVYGKKAMAATSHPNATSEAVNILKKGGNAVDAAVSAAAVLAVVEAHSTGIGGDCFCLFYSNKDKKVIALNGSGNVPKNINYEDIVTNENNLIDPYSHNAITIPGAVAAWCKLIEDYGNLSLGEVLAPAISLAREGYVVADVIADMWKREEAKLRNDNDANRIFLKNNKAYETGDIHKQEQLAETLEVIAEKGRLGFYDGYVANDIIAKINKLGGSHNLDDFINYQPEYVNPIKVDYNGYEVYECPPNGQGIVALMMLNILSNIDIKKFDPDDYRRIHLEAEVSKLAFLHRNKYLGDPNFSNIPVEKMLSKDYGLHLSKKINHSSVLENIDILNLENNKDTVYISIVDGEGNFVSFINSIFHPFGSGIVTKNTGVLLHNRGASFNLDKTHPNFFEALKKPMHTIIPALLMKNGKPIMAFGVMGAHYQPVGQVHFLTNVLDYDMDVQMALDHSRTFYYDNQLAIEKSVSLENYNKLEQLGHKVNYCDLPHGGGQAVILRDNGVLVGGSDPRKDGLALGF